MSDRYLVRYLASGLLCLSLGLMSACGGSGEEISNEVPSKNTEDTITSQACPVIAIEVVGADAGETPDVEESDLGAASEREGEAAAEESAANGTDPDPLSPSQQKAAANAVAVQLDCDGEIVSVPWRQFRKKLSINPNRFRDRIAEFNERVSCFQTAELKKNQIACQTAEQTGTEAFQVLRAKAQ